MNSLGIDGRVEQGYSRPDGASPEGVFHLAGNLYEWVEAAPCQPGGLPCPDPGQGVIRGGSFVSDAGGVRTTYRRFAASTLRNDGIGFRCATSAMPTEDPSALVERLGVTASVVDSRTDPTTADLIVDLRRESRESIEVHVRAPGGQVGCYQVPLRGGTWWAVAGAPAVAIQDHQGLWVWVYSPVETCFQRWPALDAGHAPLAGDTPPDWHLVRQALDHPRVIGAFEDLIVLTDLETGDTHTLYRAPGIVASLVRLSDGALAFSVVAPEDSTQRHASFIWVAGEAESQRLPPMRLGEIRVEGWYGEIDPEEAGQTVALRDLPLVSTTDGQVCIPLWVDLGEYDFEGAGALVYDRAAASYREESGCEVTPACTAFDACTSPSSLRVERISIPGEPPHENWTSRFNEAQLALPDGSWQPIYRTGSDEEQVVVARSCVDDSILVATEESGTSGGMATLSRYSATAQPMYRYPEYWSGRGDAFFREIPACWTPDRRFLTWPGCHLHNYSRWVSTWTFDDFHSPPRVVSTLSYSTAPIYLPPGAPVGPETSETPGSQPGP